MKRIRITAVLLALTLMASTISFAQTGKRKTTKAKNQSSAMANLDWQGKYYGITPCASCDGIETTLTLTKGNNFSLTTLYIRTTQKPKTINGKFKWKGNNIVLQNIKRGTRPTMFKVEENQVKQLNLKGKEIKGELWGAYILSKMGNTAVEDKRWKLIELNGKKVVGNAQTHYVIFHSQNGTVEAKAGCNQINNKYTIKNGLQISIKSGISTLMACPEGNIEQAFLEALANADNLSVNESNLSLNKGRMAPLARFELVKKQNYNWLYGKTFIQEGSQNIDPQLGGPAFLKFVTKDNIDLKTGDIVAKVKATFDDNKITLEGITHGRKRIFTIVNDTYLLENGIKWIAK